MSENETNAIVIKGLSFSYDGHPVLEDVNLSIPQGDFVLSWGLMVEVKPRC
jgi:ABC-type multidrug transport system fused ATPase/permease subunit